MNTKTTLTQAAASFLSVGLLMAIGIGCNDDQGGTSGTSSGSGATTQQPAVTPGASATPAAGATQPATAVLAPPSNEAPSTDRPEGPAATASPPPADGPADAPKDAPGDTPAAPSPAPAAGAAPKEGAGKRQSVGGVSFEVPEGWSLGGDKPMRLATLTDGQAEIIVSTFRGDLDAVGGLLANVNRFRGQVQLPPVASEAEAEKAFTEVDVDGRKVRTLDLKGTQSRNLVAIVPGEASTYFFRMTGATGVVDARKDVFDRFVRSVRVE